MQRYLPISQSLAFASLMQLRNSVKGLLHFTAMEEGKYTHNYEMLRSTIGILSHT